MPNTSEVNSVPLATSAQISASHDGALAASVCGGTATPSPTGNGPWSRGRPACRPAKTNRPSVTSASAADSQ